MSSPLGSALGTLFLALAFMSATDVCGASTMLQTPLLWSTSTRLSVSADSVIGSLRTSGSPCPTPNVQIGPGVPGTPAAGVTMFRGTDATYVTVYAERVMVVGALSTDWSVPAIVTLNVQPL